MLRIQNSYARQFVAKLIQSIQNSCFSKLSLMRILRKMSLDSSQFLLDYYELFFSIIMKTISFFENS